MSSTTLHILQMGKHFLYLPIYYAERHNFFGFLPAGVSVVIDPPLYKHTDVATYDQMMDDSPAYRDFVMAITDPVQILRTPIQSQRKPAVLATLVTNAAFWAVNHGKHKINGFRDLSAFDSIIAYDKGTTSYSIAERIVRDSKRTGVPAQFIRVVAPGDELTLLSDPTSSPNTVALSPDVLWIEEMKVARGVSVELALGETPEYNDVVVAALISNNEFVERNGDLVRGVICGIQQALLSVRRLDADLLQFARSYFHYGEKAEAATREAIRCGVVPSSVRLEQAHWLNAARAFREATGSGQGWSTGDEEVAMDYYRACIAPYHRIADEAMHVLDAEPRTKPERRSTLLKWLPLIAAILAVALTISLGPLPTFAIIIVMPLIWAVFAAIKRHKPRTLAATAFYIITAMGFIVLLLPFIPFLALEGEKELLVACGVGCIVPGVIEIIKHYAEPK